jgi:hypothetical protein
MDRRAIFFLGAATMSGALIPETEAALRNVPEILSLVYVLLAAASYLDWRSSR